MWRWALIVTLLLLTFVLARAGRYSYVRCSNQGFVCLVLNRWSGEVEFRRMVLPPETDRALLERDFRP